MSVKSLVVGVIASQILFIATKVLFIHYLNTDNIFVMVAFFVFLILETIAVVRRLGIINYLESFLLVIVWFFAIMICDISFTSYLIGRDMYAHIYYWLANLAILISIILFHKALHVEVRRANAGKRK
ncbi:MAG TPA: hypothetical protein VHQ20_02770 [Patescibacteria group bacterium]|nr:hypothetical protein [Patescibacteria group bacterium]